MKRGQRKLMSLVIGAGVTLAACGGGDAKVSAPTTGATATSAAPVSTEGGASGAVSKLGDVKTAAVQIIVQGEIRDASEGQTGFAASGSGFIINADGVIVTNNHVVTGAGALSVRVGGDKSNEIPAKVLGVSECNDLAVIQLTDPGPYPFLTWSTNALEPPQEVYAVGFPLGDPELTITKGVVSKAKANGDTNWASVRHVVEHDANIQPGNSGGALVDPDGHVVGVNYAGGDPGTGTAQFFAIAGDLAQPVIDALQNGDQDSIGVNGEAFISEDGSISGVWVRGVAPGGPASNSGVMPGDVITTLNGVGLGSGTMKEYCDVLRSARANTPIAIRVVRFDTQEVLEGELNGKPLEQRFSFAQTLSNDVPSGSGADTPSSDYVEVKDDTGRLVMQVPSNWTDRATAPQDLLGNGSPLPTIIAAPSIDGFNASTGPGVGMFLIEGASGVDKEALLGSIASSTGCKETSRDNFADEVFEGRYLAADCSGVLGLIVVVTRKDNPDKLVLLLANAISDADLAAIDQVLATFNAN